MTLVWRPGFEFDADASTYIEAVEAADTQALETGVRYAINDFVIGCKNDGIWDAIKASCILAGARTTNGALVPLVGDAPDPYNFDLVSDTDYGRKTGLKGSGSAKYLDANRNTNADPQNNQHFGVYLSTAGTPSDSTQLYMGGNSGAGGLSLGIASSQQFSRSQTSTFVFSGVSTSIGLVAVSRSLSASYIHRSGGSNTSITVSSQTPANSSILVFREPSVIGYYTNARIAFYSIGESLNLAALDTRVSDLITAIGAAIP